MNIGLTFLPLKVTCRTGTLRISKIVPNINNIKTLGDQERTIKGKIISAINDAIRNKNLEAIGKLKQLIDKLEMAIFRE